MSISLGDRLEFVEDRLRFEKSSTTWRIIGREEIEEIEEGSTEIGRQMKQDGALEQARLAPVDHTINRWRRPVNRPVDRCAQRG